MPGFLRPGHISFGFDEANFTEGRLRLLYDTRWSRRDGRPSFGHVVRLLYAGVHAHGPAAQRWSVWARAFATTTRGGSTAATATLSFIYPGPVFGIWARTGGLALKAQLGASFDFAGIRPLGFRTGKGASTRTACARCSPAAATLMLGAVPLARGSRPTVGTLGVGANANAAWCRSIQGLDRFEGKAVDDVTSIDTLIELDAWAGFRPPGPVELRFELEHKLRRGFMGRLSTENWDRRAAAVLAYVF